MMKHFVNGYIQPAKPIHFRHVAYLPLAIPFSSTKESCIHNLGVPSRNTVGPILLRHLLQVVIVGHQLLRTISQKYHPVNNGFVGCCWAFVNSKSQKLREFPSSFGSISVRRTCLLPPSEIFIVGVTNYVSSSLYILRETYPINPIITHWVPSTSLGPTQRNATFIYYSIVYWGSNCHHMMMTTNDTGSCPRKKKTYESCYRLIYWLVLWTDNPLSCLIKITNHTPTNCAAVAKRVQNHVARTNM
jgi:hypothetical protein